MPVDLSSTQRSIRFPFLLRFVAKHSHSELTDKSAKTRFLVSVETEHRASSSMRASRGWIPTSKTRIRTALE
jgi:hypothetical protein